MSSTTANQRSHGVPYSTSLHTCIEHSMLNVDVDEEFLDHCLPIQLVTEDLQLNMGSFSRHTRRGVVVFEPLGN